jgi:hypothetical protein
LTVTPEGLERFKALAITQYGGGSYINDKGQRVIDTFETLPLGERYRRIEAQIAPELVKMWKRLRKGGAQFRFMLVAESSHTHQGGLPHYHCLVHEVGLPLRHATLKREWTHGFTKWKLVDQDTNVKAIAWYVCKYLTKDAVARVRASVSYGREPTPPKEQVPVQKLFQEKVSGLHFMEREKTLTTTESTDPLIQGYGYRDCNQHPDCCSYERGDEPSESGANRP